MLSGGWEAASTLVRTTSANWNSASTAVTTNSAKWENVYSAVNSLSTSWEESADILPTVTNYLSTSNVSVSALTLSRVRITQTGSGDALVVQDYPNDATPFVINRNGTVVIGASAASQSSLASRALEIVSSSTNLMRRVELRSHTPGIPTGGGQILTFRRTRSANPNDFTYNFPLSAKDVLGMIEFAGNTQPCMQMYASNKYDTLSGNTQLGGIFTIGTVISGIGMADTFVIDEGKTRIGSTGAIAPSEALTVIGNVSAFSFSNQDEQYVAALSITQLGSAAAFKISDSAGGDASSFIVDNGGNTYIGSGNNTPGFYRSLYGNDRDYTGPKLVVYGGIVAGAVMINKVCDPNHPDVGLYGPSFAFGGEGNGTGCQALAPASFAQGSDTTCLSTAIAAHAEGFATTASGQFSHAEGSFTTASGDASHAEGNNTVASGEASHAEGIITTASGTFGHAEGYGTTASGETSHAEGFGTTASGEKSHAEGINTEASGEASHAEGSVTTASGTYGHAEGFDTVASGEASHAEGANTTASGEKSHAEGANTTASGEKSHAEGINTEASGEASHAEGSSTEASGNASHAEGSVTKARGSISHAAGTYTEAAHDRTWIWKGSTENAYLSTSRTDQFMVSAAGGMALYNRVGIGTDSIANALTVVGNISATGTIYSQNTLTTSVCAVSGNGSTPFQMNFTNGLLTSITF